MMEIIIKIALVVILLIAGLSYWLLPKTKLARHLKMNETIFVFTTIIGMICGVLGLIVTINWPQFIMELHLWEVILMPFVLVNVYWAMIMKIRKTPAILDEKQILNMTNAAAVTFKFSIPLMVILFILYDLEVLSGIIFFPYYFFIALLFYSASTLFYFRKA